MLHSAEDGVDENVRIFCRQHVHQCKEQLEASANKVKCPICITNDVYFVIVPCGHTICESCIEMWRGNSCPTCRTRMQSKVRFFLPGSSDA
jgi:late competence protein required for DNA uptake (superfamily II DNA/RNA helicase)